PRRTLLSFPTRRSSDLELARIPDPQRLLGAYHQSAATLNLLRAFTKGGFADLSRVHSWNRDFVASSPTGQRYDEMALGIDRALQDRKSTRLNSSHRTIS